MKRRLTRLLRIVPTLALAGCSSSSGGDEPLPDASTLDATALDTGSAVDAASAEDANEPIAPCDAAADLPPYTLFDAAGGAPTCGMALGFSIDGGVDAGDRCGINPACDPICQSAVGDAGFPGSTGFGRCAVLQGGSILECVAMACTGRRPSRLAPGGICARSRIAAHFASVAQLEAASVDAFQILRNELRAHGAPARLVRSAERSARDERRHARTTRALARRFGADLAPIRVARDKAVRSLEAIALENAREGCVRETYGAMEGLFQAHAALDPAVRAVMPRIARDEARHASLAWAVDGWARSKLGPDARRRVDEEKRRALATLRAEVVMRRDADVSRRAGLPSVEAARAMCDALAAATERRA